MLPRIGAASEKRDRIAVIQPIRAVESGLCSDIRQCLYVGASHVDAAARGRGLPRLIT